MPPRGKQVCRRCGRTVGVVRVDGVATQVESELMQVIPSLSNGESTDRVIFARRLHGDLCDGYKLKAERESAAKARETERKAAAGKG